MGSSKATGVILRFLLFLTIVAIGVAAMFVVKVALVDKPEGPRTAVEREFMDAEAAVKSDPTSVKARIKLSLAYSRAGRYNDAVEEASIAAKLDKSSATAYYALGIARSRQGDDEQAIAAFKRAVSLQTGTNEVYQQAYYELGEIYMRQKKYKDAVTVYKGALGNGPEATYVVISLAQAHEKAGDLKGAIGEYRAVLDYDPDNREAKEALVRLGAKLE
jgi:tetratricopeptide (TPR) repeat protein